MQGPAEPGGATIVVATLSARGGGRFRVLSKLKCLEYALDFDKKGFHCFDYLNYFLCLNYTVQIYQIKLHVRQAEHKTLMNKSPMIWIRIQMLLQFQPGTLREQPFNSNEIQKIRHY